MSLTTAPIGLYVRAWFQKCNLCCIQVTTDKKQLASVENQLRISKRQLDDLHQELRELDTAQITRYTSDCNDDAVKGSGGKSLFLRAPVICV